MSARPARPWLRLAPLIALVVLAHVGLLRWLQPAAAFQAARPDAARFATRTVEPAAPLAPAAAV
ncbi:MAG: hypothetical protein JWP65_3794, partial [Ramlibacter sp.]|uniref:hypothetical protein n=1 Tax=Ramlibacter sp. TaxID=1917967 RepID=UPI002638FA5F